MDSGDAASLVALVVALFALLVALAQVTQQYFATAQNMRKCDKSVFGPMPGKPSQRIWTWHQFRFRIIYDMPNVFLKLSQVHSSLMRSWFMRLAFGYHKTMTYQHLRQRFFPSGCSLLPPFQVIDSYTTCYLTKIQPQIPTDYW